MADSDNSNSDVIFFHESFAVELEAAKDRVRILIVTSHWGEDGKYKEIILMNIIKKYIQYPYKVATGFVKARDGMLSKQINILIYNGKSPAYFIEGDFVIISERALSAFVEVKTKAHRVNDIKEAIDHISTAFYININRINEKTYDRIFTGLLYYENEINLENSNVQQRIKAILSDSEIVFNHIVLGQQYFIKYWPDETKYSVYKLDKLTYTYFLSNMFESPSKQSGDQNYEQNWFRYPETGGKEGRLLFEVSLSQDQGLSTR